MTAQKLYSIIHESYGGKSDMWISDLAQTLGISYNAAEHLTQEAGFYRHKHVKNVTVDEFAKMPYARYVEKILYEYDV